MSQSMLADFRNRAALRAPLPRGTKARSERRYPNFTFRGKAGVTVPVRSADQETDRSMTESAPSSRRTRLFFVHERLADSIRRDVEAFDQEGIVGDGRRHEHAVCCLSIRWEKR